LVSLNLFSSLGLAFLALFLVDGTYLYRFLKLSKLALFLNNVLGRTDTRSFGKLILEVFQLVTVLQMIQVYGGLEVFNF
jgi:hypothetical protein